VKDIEAIRDWPDKDLIEFINQGNRNAFQHLIERYEDTVASVVIGMLGHRPDTEDIGQEIFIRVYKGMKRFRFRSSFRTYLVRIAVNVCLDQIRKSSIIQEGPEVGEFSTDLETIDENPAFEIRDSIDRALQELDESQRIVVLLRLVEGYSVKETAKILGIPEGTVLSRLSRAQEKLRDLLSHLVK
jgi:RNA polymerase sigma-70 factor (ECF subfamily)